MMKGLPILSISLLFFLSACNTETTSVMEQNGVTLVLPEGIAAIFASSAEEFEGDVINYMYLQSFSTLAVHQEGSWSSSCEGVFQDKPELIGSFTIEGNHFYRAATTSQAFGGSIPQGGTQLEGEDITVEVRDSSNTLLYSSIFYNPSYLFISAPVYNAGTVIQINNQNNNLSWTADNLNAQPLALMVKYLPTHGQNQPLATTGFEDRVVNLRLVEDDGQEPLTVQDFQGIPEGAYVDIYLIRANFQYLAKTDPGLENCMFIASSKVVFGATYSEVLE